MAKTKIISPKSRRRNPEEKRYFFRHFAACFAEIAGCDRAVAFP